MMPVHIIDADLQDAGWECQNWLFEQEVNHFATRGYRSWLQ